MASEGYHEPLGQLNEDAIDRHRVIQSVVEELEAVDWYDQRVVATDDESVAALLAHNRDEEKEHAAMGLEWLRRHDEQLDHQLRTYLFTDEPVTEVEDHGDAARSGSHTGDGAEPDDGPEPGGAEGAAGDANHSLGIGSLKHAPEETNP